jgi:hypothetical protein
MAATTPDIEIKGLDDELPPLRDQDGNIVEDRDFTIVYVPASLMSEDKNDDPFTVYPPECKRRSTSLRQVYLAKATFHGAAGDPDASEYPIPIAEQIVKDGVQMTVGGQVTEYALDLCMDWLEHHNGVEVELPDKARRQKRELSDIWPDPWDVEFVTKIKQQSVECDKLYEVMKTANHMGCVPILHLIGSAIAPFIKAKRMADIEKELGLKKANKAAKDKKSAAASS